MPTKSTAKRKSSPVEPKPAIAETPRIARPFYEPEEMSRTHELMIDAFTDILSLGGSPEDVDCLLQATMSHTRRRTLGLDSDEHTPSIDAPSIDAFVATNLDQWKADLVIAWRRNRQNRERPAVSGSTLSDLIRFNLRGYVWASFKEFMETASADEQTFMLNVLQRKANQCLPAESRTDEIYVAAAFEEELDRDGAYIKIPAGLMPAVQKYVDALRAIEDKAVA